MTDIDQIFRQWCEVGNIEQIKILLQHPYDIDVNAIDKYGRTALIEASFHGYSEIVELLLHQGADINTADQAGRTALMSACYANHIETVKLLLAHGADPHIANQYGNTAFAIACKSDFTEIIEILKDNGGACTCCDFTLKKKKFTEKDYRLLLWALGFSGFATGLFLKKGIALESLIFSYIISVVVLSVMFIRYVKQE